MSTKSFVNKEVLFLGGNIIKFDADPIRVYNILSSLPINNSTLIALTSMKLYFSKRKEFLQIKNIFDNINVNLKIIPRIPFFLFFYLIIHIIKNKTKIIHSFNYFPSIIGILLKFFTRIKLICDFGGIIPDERISSGIWKANSLKYKISKFFEKIIIENCDHVIVVSNTFKEYFNDQYKINSIVVIPSCINENRFFFDIEKREMMRKRFNLNDKIVVVFSGSFAPWDLSKEIIDYFVKLKKKITNAHFLILTMNKGKISGMILDRGLQKNDFTILSLPFDEVPDHLLMGDIALLFRSNSIVHRVGSPMKFAEYLACGLPIIGNDGLGELCKVVEDNKVGAIVDFDKDAKNEKVINDLLNSILNERESLRKRCIDLAVEQFSYKRYLDTYLTLYEN